MPHAETSAVPSLTVAPRRLSREALTLTGALIFAYFAFWAMLRPPLQTPDEPQHLLKANSILLQPWRSAPGRFDLDPRFVNPLALHTPEGLDKLFFAGVNAMTRDDIADVQRVRWPDRTTPSPSTPYARAIASYPSLYYLAVFAVAEPMTEGLGLSPWQATFAYRLATAALAALLWTMVWATLMGTPETAPLATPLLLFALANPMVGFISSGVTPDAVNNPLCALGLLLVWRVATLGADHTAALVVLVAAALTKPSGLQLAGVAAGALGLLALAGRLDRRRATAGAAIALTAAAVSVAAFYYGTPPRFMAGGPSSDTLRQYLATRLRDSGIAWRMYWGQPGWLDYHLAWPWYAALFALVCVSAACVLVRPHRSTRVAWFAAIVGVAFTAVTFAGEYHYLDVAGYTFQGRYLFPVALAFGVVLWHDVALVRRALLAGIVIFHVGLVDATVTRYYAERWAGVWQALPLHAPDRSSNNGDTP